MKFRDFYFQFEFITLPNHKVVAFHFAHFAREVAEGNVFVAFTGLKHRLTAHYTFAFHFSMCSIMSFSVPRVFGDWTFWQYCGDDAGRPKHALAAPQFTGQVGAAYTRSGGRPSLRHFCDRNLFNGSRSAFESFSYRDLAAPLIEYLKTMAFTHVEFLPVAEHAFFPSWGYQVTGFYAPSSRYGTPDDFAYLVNALHDAGIGVIVDWVPAHFPRDSWCLARFDGTALYEHEDPRQGAHQDWGTLIFNYGRHEVRNFLTANALYWCDRFHIDGLRVDAVASMLYLDYSRKHGEWVPNKYGGRENLDAVEFLKHFNHVVQTELPGVVTIAEESTSWPMVSRPPWLGGLGFTLKWNMGWMHDTLGYFKRDPVYRKYHQNDLTFAMLYHGHENFVMPLSHDEVVHGKGSLRRRMPGDDWQAFANLRTLFGYQWLFPGKKLLFMGGEFGQPNEWNANAELDWWLLNEGPYHKGLQRWMADLNQLYRNEPALYYSDYDHEGFWWIDCSDQENSVLCFIRHASNPVDDESRLILVILNMTPNLLRNYRVGLPAAGQWREVLNSDASIYGGSNQGNAGGVTAESFSVHNQPFSALFTLPPMSAIVFRFSPNGS